MTPCIKICGITRLEDARYASAVGADYIGFVHNPGDPRHTEAKVAREIIEWVVGPTPVGVFEDESAEHILALCADVGFALVQLDGYEPPDVCSAIQAGGIPVIKTMRVLASSSSEQLLSHVSPYKNAAEFIRLDVSETDLTGDNEMQGRFVRELASEFDVFLAGAIRPSNVEQVVAVVRPFAVDVSASVEESPGVKDFDKLSAFFDTWHSLAVDPA